MTHAAAVRSSLDPAAAIDPHLDGRSARALRTRETVVTSLLALLHEGNLRPTAREIATRAGISVRSVYVHFDDLDDLFMAAATHHFVGLTDILVPVDAARPLPDRIAAFVEQRSRLFEATAPVRRAALLWAPESPALEEILTTTRTLELDSVRRIFATELAHLGDGAARVVETLHLLSCGAAWEVLRHERRLPVAEARTIVAATVTLVLDAGAQ